MSRRQNPSEFLKQIIGKPVVVKLNSGVDYRGILACLDGYACCLGIYPEEGTRRFLLHNFSAVNIIKRRSFITLKHFNTSFENHRAGLAHDSGRSGKYEEHPLTEKFKVIFCDNERLLCVLWTHYVFAYSSLDKDKIYGVISRFMNIALEQTEEYNNGQLQNKYGDAFIRGNNVLYISTLKR